MTVIELVRKLVDALEDGTIDIADEVDVWSPMLFILDAEDGSRLMEIRP